jgi:large subunit ribosomal protein L25
MATKHTVSKLVLEPRSKIGTTGSHALRAEGKIPGVVYGHGEATPISIDVKQLTELVHSAQRSRIVEATIGKTKDSVLLRRVEADPITRKPLSVDFQRVTRDEAITSSVTVVTVGTARGVRDDGGVLDVVTHALDIKGPAQSIPDSLTVDVSDLGVHQHVTAADVALPKGFTLVTPPETLVVSVEFTRAEVSEGVTETPAAEAVPAAETPTA